MDTSRRNIEDWVRISGTPTSQHQDLADAIEASGSQLEETWAVIAGFPPVEVRRAAARDLGLVTA